MSEDAITSLIVRQDWLDTVGDALQKGVSTLYDNAGDAGQAVKDAMHGTWLGHPFHAAITDVPVGAWTAAVVMDAMDEMSPSDGLKRGADAAVGIGLAGAAIAAVAGLTDWSATDGKARKIGLMHGLMNIAAFGLFATSYAKRKSDDRATARALGAIGFAVAAGSAWLGGNLAYKQQIGVDHTAGQQFPDEFTAVLNDDDLHEGAMRRVEWKGSRILLARRDGQVYAIAEVCSHLGGPLAEGEFNGDEVKCPWHGSCFSIKDGSVIHGPATHPQPCLETRVRDGKIEVKSAEG
jgi:nitrite reductase/ring-hydroxylating ferredoxin subunit/uncharacterized membrane protein